MDTGLYIQDTVNTRLFIRINTGELLSDSVFRKMDEIPGYLKHADSGMTGRITGPIPKVVINDTLSTCKRNSIADVTFYDPLNFINDLRFIPSGLILSKKEIESAFPGESLTKTVVIKGLKDGDLIPAKPFHYDLIIVVIFFSAFLFLYARSALKNIVSDIRRFFLFKGINEPSSRDISSLFNWQSTLVNLISFLILSLFAFSATIFYDLKPAGMYPGLYILLLFGIIVFGITSRHFLCLATGNLSGETDAFNEYLFNVYKSYRFSSIILFVLVLLMTYTVFIPQKFCVIAGFTALIAFYIFRVARLFLIFIRRDLSILYLILYLCALEILPVLILMKYFAGLF